MAGTADAPELVRVINAAFGPAEAFFIDGDRIGLEEVRAKLETGVFLLEERLGGCVYVELRGELAYFGLLSVDPARQGSGLGKLLIAAAEQHAAGHGCRIMEIHVVNLREELPGYYGRLGYAETGEEPFPADVTTKLACHFIVMEKQLRR
jgi:GNAT superfamily N-acetyltransferase